MKKILFLAAWAITAVSLNAQTVYINEDFENGFPAGWSLNPAAGAWNIGDSSQASSFYYNIPGHTKFMFINDDLLQSSANPNSLLISPVVNLSSANTVLLTFDAFFIHETLGTTTEYAEIVCSTDGGNTWVIADSIPGNRQIWQDDIAIDLTSYIAGQSNVKIGFSYKDNTGWLLGCSIDNVKLVDAPAWDANLYRISPVAGSPNSFAVINTPTSLSGTIRNMGSNPITSVTVKYQVGSNVYPMTINNVNIPPAGLYNFTHSTPYSMANISPYAYTMWVELNADASLANDTLETTLNGVAFIPTHDVVFEDATGTWCGWCPIGNYYLDSIYNAHPTETHVITVHNNDPMTNTVYDAGMATMIMGFPTILTNRKIYWGGFPTMIGQNYASAINEFGYAKLTATPQYDANTRILTVAASATFAMNMSGDYRLALVVTEDSVTGTDPGYDQANFLSGGAYGSFGGYDLLPDPIPAAQMVYDHVGREILGGFNGASGSLPSTIVPNTSYTYTFNWTVDPGYNANNMNIILLLIDNTTNIPYIMNSTGSDMVTGVQESQNPIQMVNAFPNPSLNGNFVLTYNLIQPEETVVTILDVLGNEVMTIKNGEQQAGTYRQNVNTSNLSAGTYFVNIATPTRNSVCRIQVIK